VGKLGDINITFLGSFLILSLVFVSNDFEIHWYTTFWNQYKGVSCSLWLVVFCDCYINAATSLALFVSLDLYSVSSAPLNTRKLTWYGLHHPTKSTYWAIVW